jgi:hypothetical protein
MASSAQLKTQGYLLLASFFAVLVAIFMPLFPGAQGQKVNGLDYLDNFFNQLSKSSAYYIPEQVKKAEKYNGQPFTTSLKMKSPMRRRSPPSCSPPTRSLPPPKAISQGQRRFRLHDCDHAQGCRPYVPKRRPGPESQIRRR